MLTHKENHVEKKITKKQKIIVVAIIVSIAILVNLLSIPRELHITDSIVLEQGNIFPFDYPYGGEELPIYRYYVDKENDMVFMESRYEPFYLVLHMDSSTVYEANELDSLPKDVQDVFNDESKFIILRNSKERRHVHFD